MKNLLYGVVLLVVLGIVGFVYRNTIEGHAGSSKSPMACTLEAKICPDGTTVGRSGPNCAFAACPAGNIEFNDINLAFALPTGYMVTQNQTQDGSLLGTYAKSALASSSAATITVSRYDIPTGGTANDVILGKTTLQPSGMQPKTISQFTPKLIGGHTFQSILIERFEGQVHSAYYLVRANDVLRFDITETGVKNWTDANLIVDNLPEHQLVLKMLAAAQAGL